MKKLFIFTIILMTLAACTVSQNQAMPDTTETPQAELPNPASVYCEQNGNKLEIRTAVDGSQYGVCIFADGSTCDEWAYYRGECSPGVQSISTPTTLVAATATAGNTAENTPGSSIPPEATEEVVNWWGVIKSMGPGAQFDDFFERQDLGQVITFGIDSLDLDVKSQRVRCTASGAPRSSTRI
ncbi:MAG: DUF333 domain-containing protein [Anaerolineae bacterium]|nr:DUF333 domain-containing protein [Anaerolineae bacterium]